MTDPIAISKASPEQERDAQHEQTIAQLEAQLAELDALAG